MRAVAKSLVPDPCVRGGQIEIGLNGSHSYFVRELPAADLSCHSVHFRQATVGVAISWGLASAWVLTLFSEFVSIGRWV